MLSSVFSGWRRCWFSQRFGLCVLCGCEVDDFCRDLVDDFWHHYQQRIPCVDLTTNFQHGKVERRLLENRMFSAAMSALENCCENSVRNMHVCCNQWDGSSAGIGFEIVIPHILSF